MITFKGKSRACVVPHQGLGDIMLCIGLFRQLSSRFKTLKIVVTNKNRLEMEPFLGDLENISFYNLPSFPKSMAFRYLPQIWVELFFLFHRLLGFACIGLGGLGPNFLSEKSKLRFDENFYAQAEVEFSHRWSSFSFIRDKELESHLANRLEIGSNPYVFLHEDRSRGFMVNRATLPEGIRIIEPLNPESGFLLAHYVQVIRGASEIHTIESSFAAFIEGLGDTPRKYAHRYARPDALLDWRSEFTYRTPWIILK